VDPGPAFVFDADLDPAFHSNAGPDSYTDRYTVTNSWGGKGTIIKAGMRHSEPRNRNVFKYAGPIPH
jgi:hypothetical protein